MTQQPDPKGQDTDVDTDVPTADVPPDAVPASSDPDSFTDDRLGMGDGPDLQEPADSGS